MNEMWKQIILEGLQGIIGIIITVLLAFVRKKYSQYVNTETKQKLVNDVVYYTEQVFKTLHGKEKLDKAKTTLVTLLNEKGINFTEEELNVLIESAVNQLNLKQNGSTISDFSWPLISSTELVSENAINNENTIVEETTDSDISNETLNETVNLDNDELPKG
jgi:hypothetical protein